jgi:hypothetical protein
MAMLAKSPKIVMIRMITYVDKCWQFNEITFGF